MNLYENCDSYVKPKIEPESLCIVHLFQHQLKFNVSLKGGCNSPQFLNVCVQDTQSVLKEVNGFPYKMHVFREMHFESHCFTVVSCRPILRHFVYKNSAVYLSTQGNPLC